MIISISLKHNPVKLLCILVNIQNIFIVYYQILHIYFFVFYVGFMFYDLLIYCCNNLHMSLTVNLWRISYSIQKIKLKIIKKIKYLI